MSLLQSPGGWDLRALAAMRPLAWEAFHRSAQGKLLGWISPFEKNPEHRIDLVAAVFLAVVQQFARRRAPSHSDALLPWMRAITRHLVKTWVRGEARRRSRTGPFPEEDLSAPEIAPEDPGEPTPAQRVGELLSFLPRPEWAETLRLRFGLFGGKRCPDEEIAKRFGIAVSTVRSRVRRALEFLRELARSSDSVPGPVTIGTRSSRSWRVPLRKPGSRERHRLRVQDRPDGKRRREPHPLCSATLWIPVTL